LEARGWMGPSGDSFERVKVTNPKEHEELLSRIREVLDRSSESQ
jgi:hypothetical protein